MPESEKKTSSQTAKQPIPKMDQQASSAQLSDVKEKKPNKPAEALQQIVSDFVAANARFAERGKNSPLFPAIAGSTFDGLNVAAAALAERTFQQIQDAPPSQVAEWLLQVEALAVQELLETADQLIGQIPTGSIFISLNPPQPTLLDCIKDLLKCIVRALPFLPPLVTDIFCCLYEAACCFARL